MALPALPTPSQAYLISSQWKLKVRARNQPMTPWGPRVFFFHYQRCSSSGPGHTSLFLPSSTMSEAVLAPVKLLSNAVNNLSIEDYRARKVALITGKELFHLSISR